MHQEHLELLMQIQALEFTAVDLNLYLDTHPDDEQVLCEYANTVTELQKLRETYAGYCGPLSPTDPMKSGRWEWIEEPWPWQIEY